ncbi:MAG: spore coat protein U domain-containing protein [Proteobacteria bacterium]|nr:spore coat protein U domain-containing protein [Pseudomonadota bacterium]
MRNYWRNLSVAIFVAALSGTALAGTATTTFGVSVTVNSNCLVSASNLAFPNYTPAGGNQTASTTVSVRCTKGSPFTVALNAGTTTGGTFAQRLMSNGAGQTVEYNLYTVSNFATVWGDGTAGTSTVAGTGAGVAAGNAISETVYGQLVDSAANQGVPPGSYTDTITVTVSY